MRKTENKQKTRIRNTRVKDKKHDYDKKSNTIDCDKQQYDSKDKDKKQSRLR